MIVGLVRDKSGAVVSAVTVTVTDVDRGARVVVSTNGAGEYTEGPLRIGHYSVTVVKAGFKKAVAGPVEVNIQDRVAVDLTLEPGAATETVEVTGKRRNSLESDRTSDEGSPSQIWRISFPTRSVPCP